MESVTVKYGKQDWAKSLLRHRGIFNLGEFTEMGNLLFNKTLEYFRKREIKIQNEPLRLCSTRIVCAISALLVCKAGLSRPGQYARPLAMVHQPCPFKLAVQWQHNNGDKGCGRARTWGYSVSKAGGREATHWGPNAEQWTQGPSFSRAPGCQAVQSGSGDAT